jgi:murein DD-endopeptidase MepM/ murein hydrolase activator NlpD
VTLARAEVFQGKTVALRVRSNRPCRLSGTFGERSLAFASEDGLQHAALVGVSAIADSGEQGISIMARSQDGQELSLTTRVRIVAGKFGREVLHFAPEVAKLLEPKTMEAEQVRLAEAFAASAPRILWQGTFDWPCPGAITSEFGTRRGYESREGSYHAGIDISGNIGDPVRAAAAGTVVLAERLQVRGNAVIVDHGAGVFSGYCHLDSIDAKVGQSVRRGDVLGRVGATGLVTGAHLHWELRVSGVAVDPKEWTTNEFP